MTKILTEEELELNERLLKNSVRAKAMYDSDYSIIEDIIASHRALHAANAELSFKNMKYKKALETINNGSGSGKSVGASYREIAEKTLEETK